MASQQFYVRLMGLAVLLTLLALRGELNPLLSSAFLLLH